MNKNILRVTSVIVLCASINSYAVVPGATSAFMQEQEARFLANPNCMTSFIIPDAYTLGTGVNLSGACLSFKAGIDAENTIVEAAEADASYWQQVEQVGQQVLTVQNLVIQTEQLIKDIEENPLQVLVPDVKQILANQERINKLTSDIGNNAASIGQNAMKDLQYPDTIGLGMGSKWQLWSQARAEAVKENFATYNQFVTDMNGEWKNIDKAIKNLNGARGQRANARALSNASGQQLSMLQKIQEILMKMMNLQSAEAGAKMDSEIETLKRMAAEKKAAATPPSAYIDTNERSCVTGADCNPASAF